MKVETEKSDGSKDDGDDEDCDKRMAMDERVRRAGGRDG